MADEQPRKRQTQRQMEDACARFNGSHKIGDLITVAATPGKYGAWSDEGPDKSGRYRHSLCSNDQGGMPDGTLSCTFEETGHKCVGDRLLISSSWSGGHWIDKDGLRTEISDEEWDAFYPQINGKPNQRQSNLALRAIRHCRGEAV